MRLHHTLVAAVLLPLLAAACDEAPVTLPQPESVSVATQDLKLTVGDLAPLAAQVLDQKGNVLPGLTLTFSSDNPAVATVDRDGTVRAVSPGTANVTAAYGNARATARVSVARDERGFVQTLDVLADSVVTDVRAGSVAVSLRAFNGYGQPVCPAVTVRSSDAAVATGTSPGGCRVTINSNFSGVATLVVSADGARDSVRVRVSGNGATAFVASRPATSDLFAGNTVSYAVRVLDEQGKPLANRTVHFSASAGLLSGTVVTTDATGTATVQWTLPTDLRTSANSQPALSFATQLPSGLVISRSESVFVSPAPVTDITLYRIAGSTLVPITGTTVQGRLYEYVYIGASAKDPYGNNAPMSFSVTSPAYLSCSSSGYYWSNDVQYSCAYSYTPGTATYTVTSGGKSKSVTINFVP